MSHTTKTQLKPTNCTVKEIDSYVADYLSLQESKRNFTAKEYIKCEQEEYCYCS